MIISVLVVLFLWWAFGDKYYVKCELIYQQYTEYETDKMILNNVSLDKILENGNLPEEVEKIVKTHDASEYDLLFVWGGTVEGLLLSHDNVYYCKPISVERDSDLISYYLIPNVGFIPDDWY